MIHTTLQDWFTDSYVGDVMGCWLWTKARYRKTRGKPGYSYGVISKHSRAYRLHKEVSAHRLAYKMYKGVIPPDMSVLHSCDTPHCVNPGHLFLGSPQQNSQDMVNKDRQEKGCSRYNAKMTPENVKLMRNLHSNGWTTYELGGYFDISRGTVSNIVAHTRWKHVT